MSPTTITADSQPIFAWAWTMLTSLFGSGYWSADDWITWHKALVQRDGQDKANQEFIQAFNRAGLGSFTTDFRDSDPLKSYAQSQGFFDGICPGVIGAIVKGTSQLGSTAQNILSGIEYVSTWFVPVAVVAALSLGVWYVYNNFIKK